jgi:predicted MFS family arabinose efflux permease
MNLLFKPEKEPEYRVPFWEIFEWGEAARILLLDLLVCTLPRNNFVLWKFIKNFLSSIMRVDVSKVTWPAISLGSVLIWRES